MKAQLPRTAVVSVHETRERFRGLRDPFFQNELKDLQWLSQECEVIFSDAVIDFRESLEQLRSIAAWDPHLLIIHIPVWSDPVLSVRTAQLFSGVPVLLLGNSLKETSSMVGIFGAAGALDQIGISHMRIFNHRDPQDKKQLIYSIRAAYAARELRGQIYGQIGGRSLGMITAVADPAQWQRLFGVDTEHIDQLMIVDYAQKVPDEEVEAYAAWLKSRVKRIVYNDFFTDESLRRQVRSYLATRIIKEEMGLDFLGVKCQPELCDTYTTQCLSHMLCNSSCDMEGAKQPVVHACEADSDGALTMQIMHLLSGGRATALLDMRWLNPEDNTWILANCGAIAADFYRSEDDPTGLGSLEVIPHVIGKAGSCGYPMMVEPGEVTLARLIRKEGEYTMFILLGQVLKRSAQLLRETTASFPQAYITMPAGPEFMQNYGSNHLHMVRGNIVEELKVFCSLKGIPCRVYV